MIHRDQQVAGRSASRRASVDFPAAIFPHRDITLSCEVVPHARAVRFVGNYCF